MGELNARRMRAVLTAAGIGLATLASVGCTDEQIDYWFPSTPAQPSAGTETQPSMTVTEPMNPSTYAPELTEPESASSPASPTPLPAAANGYSPATYPPELTSTGTGPSEETVGVKLCGTWVQMPKIGFVPSDNAMIVKDYLGHDWAIGDRGRVIGSVTEVRTKTSDNPFRAEIRFLVNGVRIGTPATPPGTCPSTATGSPYNDWRSNMGGGGGGGGE